jgi:hypothetical protein
LVITVSVTTFFDIVGGARRPSFEVTHLIEVVGVVLLWMLAGTPGLDRLRRRGHRVRARLLH